MSSSPPVKSRDAVGAHHVEGIPHDVVADGFSDTMTNFFGDIDVWYRQKACPLIIRVLPAWCTANMVTTGNLTTAAVCISAALFVDNDPDHFWRSSFLQLVVMCTAVGYSFIDVLDGEVARKRGHGSRFGGALDHFCDSLASPLTAGAMSIAGRTLGRIAIANTIMVTFIFCMEATIENDTDEWFEPPPGGSAAAIASAAYVFLNFLINAAVHFGLVDEWLGHWTWLTLSFVLCVACIPPTLALIRSAGWLRACETGFLFMVSIAVFGVLTEESDDGYLQPGLVREGATGLSAIQFILLVAAVSCRVSGGMVRRTCERQRANGFDWRALAWTAIVAFVFTCRRFAPQPFEAGSTQEQWLHWCLQRLPFLAAADLILRGMMDMRALYVRFFFWDDKRKQLRAA